MRRRGSLKKDIVQYTFNTNQGPVSVRVGGILIGQAIFVSAGLWRLEWEAERYKTHQTIQLTNLNAAPNPSVTVRSTGRIIFHSEQGSNISRDTINGNQTAMPIRNSSYNGGILNVTVQEADIATRIEYRAVASGTLNSTLTTVTFNYSESTDNYYILNRTTPYSVLSVTPANTTNLTAVITGTNTFDFINQMKGSGQQDVAISLRKSGVTTNVSQTVSVNIN